MSEIFQHVLSLPISDGALVNTVNRVAQKTKPAYELIRKAAKNSKVNGGDETGMKIDGGKGRFWTIQGFMFTYIMASLNREHKHLNNIFQMGLLFPYFCTIAGDVTYRLLSLLIKNVWSICYSNSIMYLNVTILNGRRNLNNSLPKPSRSKRLFCHEIIVNHQFKYRNLKIDLQNYYKSQSAMNILIAVTFQNRLIIHRKHIFTFLYHHEVPPDNNGSERAMRIIKVKQKLSGQFKS